MNNNLCNVKGTESVKLSIFYKSIYICVIIFV